MKECVHIVKDKNMRIFRDEEVCLHPWTSDPLPRGHLSAVAGMSLSKVCTVGSVHVFKAFRWVWTASLMNYYKRI